MLRAKTQAGEFVTLALLPKQQIEKVRKSNEFFCPECQGAVIVRAGPKVIPHFAHRTKTVCSQRGGEGAYHQKGKLLLLDWLRSQNLEVELEVYLPEIKQRPDLFVRIGTKIIAVEFQCTTISVSEIRKRNRGYKRMNITPIWIVGSNQFKRISTNHLHINTFTLQFVQQFSSTLPTTLLYFCPLKDMFSIVNDLYMTSINRAIAKIIFKKRQTLPFPQLFSHQRFSQEQLYQLWKKEKRKFRLKRSHAYGSELKWRYWLYEKGLHPELLPSVIYLPVAFQHKMRVPLWNWQSRFMIDFFHPLAIGNKFTLASVQRFLQVFRYDQDVFPLVGKEDPIANYLALLCNLQIIHRTNETTYIKKKSLQFYARIDHAVHGDDELLNFIMYNHRQE